ncbi:MAG: VCBS repeat-containing protein [Deltaproteobacteria bacterium]|nr:VCBS repeat-containing protein [Deltaproteobacteria bacterium]
MRLRVVAATLLTLLGCSRNFVAPKNQAVPLQLTCDATQLAPGDHASVHPGGGDGNYTLSVADPTHGGTVTPDGVYTAGLQGNLIDTIVVTDGTQARASVNVQVGPPLVLSPDHASTVPGGQLTFLAQGGKPPYTFRMAPRSNSSFGTITSSGQYTAGINPDVVDRVEVIDQIGITTQAPIAVGDTTVPIVTFGATQLKTGDFNGDGRQDVVVISGTVLEVILSTPTTPVLTQTMELPCDANALTIVDEDGDGHDDILGDCSGTLFLLRGGFDGQLIPAAGWPWHATIDGGDAYDFSQLATVDARPAVSQEAVVIVDHTIQGSLSNPFFVVALAEEGDGGGGNTDLGPAPFQLNTLFAFDMSGLGITGVSSAATSAQVSTGHDAMMVTWSETIASVFGLTPIIGVASHFQGGPYGIGQPSMLVSTPTVDCAPQIAGRGYQLFDVNGDGIDDAVHLPLATELCVNLGLPDGGFDHGIAIDPPHGESYLFPLWRDVLHPADRLMLVGADALVAEFVDGGWAFEPAPPLPELTNGLAADVNGDGRMDYVTFDDDHSVVYRRANVLGDLHGGREFQVQPQTFQSTSSSWPRSSRVVGSLKSGVAVLDTAADGGLSLEDLNNVTGLVGVVANADQHALWGTSPWSGQLVGVPFDSSPELHVDVPAASYLWAVLDEPGDTAGSVLLVLTRDGGLAMTVETDGGVSAETTFPWAETTVGVYPVQSASGRLNDLVELDGTRVEFYPGATDGSVAWPATPTQVFDATTLPDLQVVGVQLSGPAFPMRVGDRSDTLIFAAEQQNTGTQYYFTLRPADGELHAIGTNLYRASMLVADVDGDGLTDLLGLVTESGSYNVHFFRQRADASFEDTRLDSLPITYDTTLLPMDVDNDGRVDLVLANFKTGRIQTLLNRTQPGGTPDFE